MTRKYAEASERGQILTPIGQKMKTNSLAQDCWTFALVEGMWSLVSQCLRSLSWRRRRCPWWQHDHLKSRWWSHHRSTSCARLRTPHETDWSVLCSLCSQNPTTRSSRLKIASLQLHASMNSKKVFAGEQVFCSFFRLCPCDFFSPAAQLWSEKVSSLVRILSVW